MSSLTSFAYFNNKKIVIPKIQRDYAEGREIGRIPEIRHSLLNEMISVACGEKNSTELDFVYGYEKNGNFEPLDGQQRLTTLFLLYWFLSENKNQITINGKSKLSYTNRQSSADFCEELVSHKSKDIIQDYLNKRSQNINNNGKHIFLKDYIKELGWYRWNWNYDSTIQSMLVVINDIYDIFNFKSNYDYNSTSSLFNNLDKIKFRFLNLDDFSMGDELYIKMNARGKELSSFDLLKSFLERDLSKNNSNNQILKTKWQSRIDCEWMDFLWWKYYTCVNVQDRNIAQIEVKFEQILHLLIWYQIVKKFLDVIDNKEIKNKNIDNIISVYKNHSNEINFHLDYELLIKQFDALFLKDNNYYYTIENSSSVFDESFLNNVIEKKEYDALLFLFAQITWLLEINSINEIHLNANGEKDNYDYYLKFIKNIFTLENADVQRLDSPKDFVCAMEWITDTISAYKNCNQTIRFIQFVRDNIIYRRGNPVYENSIFEEKKKAELILLDPNWKSAIENAESNEYLNGQIFVLLNIEQTDYNRFNNVLNKFNEIFDGTNDKNNAIRLLQLMMLYESYNTVNACTKNKTLIEITKDRDYSLKHHFRDSSTCVLSIFSSIINYWITTNNALNYNDFYNSSIANYQALNFIYWRNFLITNSNWYDSISKINKHLLTEEENNRLWIKKPINKEEIIICHIHGVVKNDDILFLLDDQCGDESVAFLLNNTMYKVENTGVNQYSLFVNGIISMQNVCYEIIINELNTIVTRNIF